jgi:two-component system NtrC family sensor kinase
MPPETQDVSADPQQMQQVFINILANARDAMRNGGSLRIAVKKEQGFVVASFIDSGSGIPEEMREKIFEPFFTTKENYGEGRMPGTGLGLTVSQEIVKSHGGRISIEGGDTGGAKVSVWIPEIKSEI